VKDEPVVVLELSDSVTLDYILW